MWQYTLPNFRGSSTGDPLATQTTRSSKKTTTKQRSARTAPKKRSTAVKRSTRPAAPPAPTREECIEDLQRVSTEHPGVEITRNFYRRNGKFNEAVWNGFFPKFNDFLDASGITPEAQGQDATPQLTETSEIVGDTWNLTLPRTRIKTLEELLDYCEVDTSVWTVRSFIVNKWEMGAKDRSDNVQVTPLFQVKASLTRSPEMSALTKEVESLIKRMQQSAPVPSFTYKRGPKTGNMLEINIPDLHAGKLAWSKETGYQNYDLNTALATFRRALAAILGRVSHLTFDLVLFVVGNDLLHADDLEGRTTSGTYVNTDGRYHKCFEAVRDLMIEAVEQLRKLAPVKVISCPGNHDTKVAWHVADSMAMYFHKYKDVEIDRGPDPRKFHRHGDVMLMFTHGHGGKRKDYPLTMATERRKMWGDTRFCEIHTGHLHQVRTEEQQGVRVRILSALCPPDAWHSNNNFVGNLRSASGFVWNATEGLTDQVYYNEAD